jgi:hypothetical protein
VPGSLRDTLCAASVELFVDIGPRSLPRGVPVLSATSSISEAGVRSKRAEIYPGACTLHPHLGLSTSLQKLNIPNCIPRPGIDNPLSRRSQGENPLSRHSVDENAPISSPPNHPRLLPSRAYRIQLLSFAKKGVRRELHGGPRSPIFKLPHLCCTLGPDCDELASSASIFSRFVDVEKIRRCDSRL